MIPRKQGRSLLVPLSCLLVAAACSSCTSSASNSFSRLRGGIIVASFNFPESLLLADVYAGALRARGYPAIVQGDAGPRELVDPALTRGLVDLVPEYSGSALLFFSLGRGDAGPDIGMTHDALVSALAPHGLVPLAPSPAQDANAVVVTQATAERYALHSISDLITVARHLAFGGPSECPHRPLCLQGLRQVYGLQFEHFFPLDTGGPLTLQALVTGEIDVGLLFTTNPEISARHLVVLTDDRGLQPAENVTPVLRGSVLARYGSALQALIDRVSARLTTESVTALNARLSSGVSARRVADGWLASEGLG